MKLSIIEGFYNYLWAKKLILEIFIYSVIRQNRFYRLFMLVRLISDMIYVNLIKFKIRDGEVCGPMEN